MANDSNAPIAMGKGSTHPAATAITVAARPENSGNWIGRDLAGQDRWRFHLRDSDGDEINAALAGLRAGDIPWQAMCREDFPLPGLATTLAAMSRELEEGCGLARLDGLDPSAYSEVDLRRIMWGLGLYLGAARYQDFNGLLMRDITDLDEDTDARLGHVMATRSGQRFVSSKARTASNGVLRFHTDRCDVVALLCVQAAASGGANHIASQAAVHNRILAERPDLLRLLYSAYPRSRLGEERGGEAMVYQLPVFGLCEGRLTSHYSRTYIEAAQETPGVSPLSAAQWEALDMLQASCEDLAMEMRLAPGDLQFLNNHMVYHARDPYRDPAPGTGARRLLYRLWLSTPCSRALPADHQVLWGAVGAGVLRGGIRMD